ncbi:hypothetical protein OJF2_56060 [Aquisphaera giovannonii]|uniref:DUF1559 domain-containing protein n=1 Tax=Aquisphaera giovannonii TaxID=406548 RepID=A0A5B9WAB5_9BACT|nr:DUF1559 domain-containing protein [Aquisphaera giovannonii]QEH37021.1 hypothetical protein OJF2_56060 [Aquisphaera giovannonii]
MRRNGSSTRRLAGFTLVELVTVIGIIAVLIALLLPAIQSSRESARRLQCTKNLVQIGIALANYASSHRVFPPGVVNDDGPITNMPEGYHFGWAVQILPQLEKPAHFRAFDFGQSVYAEVNDTARTHVLSDFLCPSNSWPALTNYAACHHDVEAPIDRDNHGVFFLNSRVSLRDLSDGPACTILVGEIVGGESPLGWAVGTTSSLRNTGTRINESRGVNRTLLRGAAGNGKISPESIAEQIEADALPEDTVGGFSSQHGGGANFLFGDGSVRFLDEKIDPNVYRSLGHRNDGNLISDDAF